MKSLKKSICMYSAGLIFLIYTGLMFSDLLSKYYYIKSLIPLSFAKYYGSFNIISDLDTYKFSLLPNVYIFTVIFNNYLFIIGISLILSFGLFFQKKWARTMSLVMAIFLPIARIVVPYLFIGDYAVKTYEYIFAISFMIIIPIFLLNRNVRDYYKNIQYDILPKSIYYIIIYSLIAYMIYLAYDPYEWLADLGFVWIRNYHVLIPFIIIELVLLNKKVQVFIKNSKIDLNIKITYFILILILILILYFDIYIILMFSLGHDFNEILVFISLLMLIIILIKSIYNSHKNRLIEYQYKVITKLLILVVILACGFAPLLFTIFRYQYCSDAKQTFMAVPTINKIESQTLSKNNNLQNYISVRLKNISLKIPRDYYVFSAYHSDLERCTLINPEEKVTLLINLFTTPSHSQYLNYERLYKNVFRINNSYELEKKNLTSINPIFSYLFLSPNYKMLGELESSNTRCLIYYDSPNQGRLSEVRIIKIYDKYSDNSIGIAVWGNLDTANLLNILKSIKFNPIDNSEDFKYVEEGNSLMAKGDIIRAQYSYANAYLLNSKNSEAILGLSRVILISNSSESRYDRAKDLLSQIKPNDNNYGKAQELIESFARFTSVKTEPINPEQKDLKDIPTKK